MASYFNLITTMLKAKKIQLTKEQVTHLLDDSIKNKEINKALEDIENHEKAVAQFTTMYQERVQAVKEAMNVDVQVDGVKEYLDFLAANSEEDTDYKFVELSSKESQKNAQIQKAAQSVYAEKMAMMSFVQNAYSSMQSVYGGPTLGRAAQSFIFLGANTVEQALSNIKLVLTGDAKEKQKFFDAQVKKTIDVLKESMQYKDEMDAIAFYKENGSYLYGAAEFDGTKIKNIANDLGVSFENVQSLVEKYAVSANDASYAANEIEAMANPYYSKLHLDNCQKISNGMAFELDLNDQFDVFNKTLAPDSKLPGSNSKNSFSSLEGFYNSYLNVAQPTTVMLRATDSLNFYLEDKKAILYKEDGTPLQENVVDTAVQQLMEGQRLLVKDENGSVLNLLSMHKNSGAIDYHNKKLDLNLNHVEESIQKLTKMVKDLDPLLVMNNDFKPLKNYINGMEAEFSKTHDFNSMVKKLGELATEYLEAKYPAEKSKSELTYKREDFAASLKASAEEYLENAVHISVDRQQIELQDIGDDLMDGGSEPFPEDSELNTAFIDYNTTKK